MNKCTRPSPMLLLQTSSLYGLRFVRGQGAYLTDDRNRIYLDMLSGLWCCALGHCHPRFVSALQNQLERIVHLHNTHSSCEIEDAGERLGAVLPGELNRITWLNTGSEAVELSLNIARIANGEDGVVVWERGYYGATNLAISLSNPVPDNWCKPRIWRVPAPDCHHCRFGMSHPDCDFECLERSFEDIKRATAVLYEPVIAVGGVIVPPAGYGLRVQEKARQANAVLILEEVSTGLGRTGFWFGFQRDGLQPDILVLGKVLGNGLPVAAVVTTAEIETRCAGRLRHVQSHQNDPWSGAIAAAVIDILQSELLVERCAAMGKLLLEGLTDLVTRCEEAVEARGQGLMAAIELKDREIGQSLKEYLLDESILVDFMEPDRCLRFFPAYIIERRELERVLDLLEHGIMKARGGQGL